MNRIEKIFLAVIMAGLATPALAGPAAPVPAPVVGVGIGAVVLIGIGYRVLKSRINH
jgi:hypothetical protein